MKLAEALILRADCQKRIQQLETRLINNAMVQDGETPAENPSQLRSELEDISEQLLLLIKRINRTNSLNQVDEGLTFSDALANRDILHLKHGIYRNLAQAATVTQTRHSKSEVKFNSTVDVKEIQEVASRLAQEHRQLDARIQEANWRVELLE